MSIYVYFSSLRRMATLADDCCYRFLSESSKRKCLVLHYHRALVLAGQDMAYSLTESVYCAPINHHTLYSLYALCCLLCLWATMFRSGLTHRCDNRRLIAKGIPLGQRSFTRHLNRLSSHLHWVVRVLLNYQDTVKALLRIELRYIG